MDNEPVPAWEKAPTFIQFTLQEYAARGALLQPMIAVFPAAKYAADNNGAAQSVQRLRALISTPGRALNNGSVPFVPFFNATQTFIAQAKPLKFQDGVGVRMLTQYDQAPIPINNHELIYHFEGLTNDGQFYVIAVLPITSLNLPADGKLDSAVPAGGVPFNSANPQAYFDAITNRLNSVAPDAFSPSISSLDSLIGSINLSIP